MNVDQPVRQNPFPGLRSFELQDAALFFGRDNQIQELQEKESPRL